MHVKYSYAIQARIYLKKCKKNLVTRVKWEIFGNLKLNLVENIFAEIDRVLLRKCYDELL